MAKKRTELPPELVAEWADDRTIEEVLTTPGKLGGGTKAKVKWRCQVKGCGHEWEGRLSHRLAGRGCRVCGFRTLYVITVGLAGEVGDVMELLKKHIRDNTPIDKQHLACELGDVLVYLIRIANRFDLTFDEVVEAVADKLDKRVAKGSLRGSGEDR